MRIWIWPISKYNSKRNLWKENWQKHFQWHYQSNNVEQIIYQEFIQNRLHSSKYFFASIKRNNLKTGIKRKKKGKEPSTKAVFNEDRQAFDVLVFKLISKQNTFAHPITYVPLAVVTPEGEPRQSDKYCLRNFLIREANLIFIEFSFHFGFLWYSSFVINFPRFFKRLFRPTKILLLRHSQNNYQMWLYKLNLMCEEFFYQIINTSAVNKSHYKKENISVDGSKQGRDALFYFFRCPWVSQNSYFQLV